MINPCWECTMVHADCGRLASRREPDRFKARRIAFICLASVTLALGTMSLPAQAKIELDGSSDAARLTTEDASIGEILAALAARFKLTYTPTPDLDRSIGGIYSGSLQQ